jgi:hypothetical protein
MALDDVKHVEAVALIRRLCEEGSGFSIETTCAVESWLEQNHPSSAAYVAAAKSVSD